MILWVPSKSNGEWEDCFLESNLLKNGFENSGQNHRE